jgi:hypothetical protein
LLEAYQAKNPLVHLDFVEGSPAEHVSAVQHHRMDTRGRPSRHLLLWYRVSAGE